MLFRIMNNEQLKTYYNHGFDLFRKKNEEYLQKIGCHPEEFLKFANPGSLYATWDTVTRWQYIKPEEEK